MATATLPLIDVDRLRLGMYVVLDVGWRDHPFAFSSFTLRTAEQLDQLRSLGSRQVRYCPERSSAQPLPAPEMAPSPVTSPAAPATSVQSGATLLPSLPQTPLQQQQAALQRTEGGYRQAAQSHQRILKQLLSEPKAARAEAEHLSTQLLATVADGEELAVRLLSQSFGSQPSGHEIGVSALALMLARECGFNHDALHDVVLSALLHDMGKVRIPAFLHEDHGQLTEFERRTYRQHLEFGVEAAVAMGLSRNVILAISEHHERYDGSGFPGAIGGAQLSPAGRILAIVNRYQNLVCPLHVEAGLTPHRALQQMYGAEREHFDPVFLPRFVRVMGIYPPGTLVELSDRRMAVVVAARAGMSLSPTVQVMEMPDQIEPGLAIDLDPNSGPRVRCSLQPQQLNERWAQRARQLARSAIFIEPRNRQSASTDPLDANSARLEEELAAAM